MNIISVEYPQKDNTKQEIATCQSTIIKAHRKVGFFIAYRKVRRRMSNEKQIEQEIQDKGLNAPRLTPDHIDSVIAGETYTNLPDGRTVICQLTLQNGYTIDGKSACVSKENFNQEIGNKIARQNAREKIWELEGYLLKEKLYQAELDKQF